MIHHLRFWAPVAALGLIIGCAGEEGAGTAPAPAEKDPVLTPDASVDGALTPPPVVEAPKTDEAPPLTPAEEPKAEEPKAEEPKADAPKAEEPKAEEPKAEEPKADADAPQTPPQAEEPKAEAAPGLDAPKTAAVELSDEEIAEIKKLPAEDQEAALAQAVCPVSGEHLGGMDVPVKTSIDGRDFFLCCNGCMKKVKNDPKGVLAALDAK